MRLDLAIDDRQRHARVGGIAMTATVLLSAAASLLVSPTNAAAATAGSAAISPLPNTPQIRRRTEVDIKDATEHFVKSTESTFDHMIELSREPSTSLHFHWNDVDGNTITGRLVHHADNAGTSSGWLGFGIYDSAKNGDNPGPADPLMVGSDAVIGNANDGKVEKFNLSDKKYGEGGVHPMVYEQQTLVKAQTAITRHEGDDGSVTTVMTFEKLLVEDNEEEIRIKAVGRNIFLWAVGGANGAPEGGGLGFHVERGAISLDFDEVKTRAEQGEIGAGEEGAAGGGGTAEKDPPPEDPIDINTDQETSDSESDAPVVQGECESPDAAYLRMVQLTPNLDFHWNLNDITDAAQTGQSVSIKLEYRGKGWIAVGFSRDGAMIGSEAVIGLPDEGAEKPLKYVLTDKAASSITPMDESQQTLQDANIVQTDDTTTLTFTKILSESNEIHLNAEGMTTFLYAIGTTNTLAYHEHRGSFQVDLSTCTADLNPKSESKGTVKSHMGAWAAHGTIATLAWAVSAPFAITTAWFRTLVPSSWIYVHVFANVTTFFLTLVAFIIAVVSMSLADDPSHFSRPHHWVGLVMLLFVTFQVMNGFLRPPVEKKDPYGVGGRDDQWISLPNSPRAIWHFIHRCVGVSLLAMGIWQIQDGLTTFADDFDVTSIAPFFWVYVGLFAAMLVGLRLWIMWEEYKARKGMEAVTNVDQRRVSNLAKAGGVDPDSELVPVQMEMH